MRRLGVLAAFTVAAAAGCSAFFHSPVVRISDVRVIGVGLSGATAEVELSVVNPNTFSLRSRSLRYRVEYGDPDMEPAGAPDPEEDSAAAGGEPPAAWRLLAEGSSDQVVTVPADDSATVRLAVPFRYSDLGRAVLGLVRTGALTYRVTGDVLFDGPVGDFRVPFRDTGALTPGPGA